MRRFFSKLHHAATAKLRFSTLHHAAAAKLRCAAVLFPEMANGRMPQGGGGSAITAATPSRKRRADALGPAATAAAGVPTHGIMLPNGEVPVLAFPGGPVVDEKALRGVDAAVAALGGKARVGELVGLVEAAMARVSPPSAAAAVGGDASGGDGGQQKKAKMGRPTNLLTQAVETVLDGVAPAYIQRVGRSAACKHLRRVVQELTWHGGVLRFRREWPWLPGTDDLDRLCSKDLSVHRKEPRFPTADFGGHDAELPASETRAHRAREGRPFGLNFEEYLTPGEEIKRLRDVLAFYDDQMLWRCFASGHDDAQRRGRDVDSAMAKEIISFARDAEPSTTMTWTSDWPYAVASGADGASNTTTAWEYCQVVRVHSETPSPSASSASRYTNCTFDVRLRAEPDVIVRGIKHLRARPNWQRQGAVFVQPSSGGGVWRLGDAVALIKRYDMAVLAGKLQDTISAAQLRCDLEDHRAEALRLLARQPRNNAERQLMVDHVNATMGDVFVAAPKLLSATQLAEFCKQSSSLLQGVSPIEGMRCTPSAFMTAPKDTRRAMVEWCVLFRTTHRNIFCFSPHSIALNKLRIIHVLFASCRGSARGKPWSAATLLTASCCRW